MKKVVSMLLVLVLCACGMTALADEEKNVLQIGNQTTSILLDEYSNKGYIYAKMTNTGDKPCVIDEGVFQITNSNGEVIGSDDYPEAYVRVLEPGEYTYVSGRIRFESQEIAMASDGYSLKMYGISEERPMYKTTRYPCKVELHKDQDTGYGSKCHIAEAVFENTTNEPLGDVSFVCAFLDNDGNVVYIDSADIGLYVKLNPGSSITVTFRLGDDHYKYLAENGFEVAGAEAIAYVNGYTE